MTPPDRAGVYRALAAVTDLDALHELVAARGVEVLDSPFPYLVVAARNRVRDTLRRQGRAPVVEPRDSDTPAFSSPVWDPLETAVAHDELRRALDVLASMDDRDVLVVWLSAQNRSDEEIAGIWDELGFQPGGPSLSAIRKRRERARQELRRRLG